MTPDEAAAAARAAEADKRKSFKKLRVQEPGADEEEWGEEMED